MTPTAPHAPRLRSCALALLAALVVALPGLAEARRARRVPPEMVGAFCPPGGCPPAVGSPWHTAAFATAVGAVALLARRRQSEPR